MRVCAPTAEDWAVVENQPLGNGHAGTTGDACQQLWRRARDTLVVEDDIEFAKGWEARLDRTIREIVAIHGDNFLLSLYCAYGFVLPAYERGELFTKYPLEVFAGTQGIYLPARIRADFRTHLKEHGVDGFRVNYDMILREYLMQNDIPTYVTAPSLVQHMGLVTTGLSQNRHYSPVFFDEV